MYEYSLHTGCQGFIDITGRVQDALQKSGVQDGFAVVYCPHTTAGITINENADPDVVSDLLFALDQIYPDRPEFQHMEGNSAAHLKSSVMGCQTTILIEQGKLVLGTWQGIYFCEFDGPRNRRFFVKIMGTDQ